MPGVARVHRNSRRAQSGAGAAAGPAKAHRTRPPDRAQAAPRNPPPKDAAVKTGPHFSEDIRLTLMGRRAAVRAASSGAIRTSRPLSTGLRTSRRDVAYHVRGQGKREIKKPPLRAAL